MKRIVCMLAVLAIASVASAKEYTVVVDDKYVPYFEAAFADETTISGGELTPEEWLAMQAMNTVDMVINQAFIKKEIVGKTRDEKIEIIK